jgi:proteasome lid subunit RPN8/RPN11
MPVWNNRRPKLGVAPVLLLIVGLASTACASARSSAPTPQSVSELSVDDAAVRQWHFLFTRVSGVEWMTCLYGQADRQGVRISRSELADIATTGYTEVTGNCRARPGDRLIGLAHSHPRRVDGSPSCMPSATDKRFLGDPWQIVLVVCDTNETSVQVGYNVHGHNTVVTSLAVKGMNPPVILTDDKREQQ